MLPGLGLLILVVPVIELAVIIWVGSSIGYLETVGLLILISIVGAVLLKREGLATWKRLQATLQRGEMPTDEVTDGAFILLGGAFLLTPGFVTDIVGLSFIFGPTRATMKGAARKLLGALALKRFGAAGAAAAAGRKVYTAQVSRSRRKDPASSPRESFPSELPGPSDEDGSPGRG